MTKALLKSHIYGVTSAGEEFKEPFIVDHTLQFIPRLVTWDDFFEDDRCNASDLPDNQLLVDLWRTVLSNVLRLSTGDGPSTYVVFNTPHYLYVIRCDSYSDQNNLSRTLLPPEIVTACHISHLVRYLHTVNCAWNFSFSILTDHLLYPTL